MTIDLRFISLIALLISFPMTGWGQTIGPEYSGKGLAAFADLLRQEEGISLYFPPEVAQSMSPSLVEDSSLSLSEYLNRWTGAHGFAVHQDQRGNYLITKTPLQTSLNQRIYPDRIISQDSALRPISSEITLSTEFIPRVITVGTRKDGLGRKQITITGTISDVETGEPIPQASLLLPEIGKGILADDEGAFILTIPRGSFTLVVRDVGHEELRITLEALSSGQLSLSLLPRELQLEDVVISSERDNPVQNTQMGFERINPQTIKEVPVVLGERDLLKVASLLPGVQSVGEGSGGLNIRGAPADQNMFYLEHVPVYNTSHMFGFFSAFHPDAISGFSLYKSHLPGEFGGRLAGVFDIEAREASKEEFQLEGGISPVTGRLVMGTPMMNGRSSLLLGARSTYSNWILRRIPNNDFRNSDLYFGDASLHYVHDLNDRNKLSLFGYGSLDNTRFGVSTDIRSRNLGGSMTWRHFFDDRNDLEVNLVHSQLSLDVANSVQPSEAYRLDNQLHHSEVRAALTMRPDNANRIRTGVNAILYQNDRGAFGPFGESSVIAPINLGAEQGIEAGIFLEDEVRISERLSAQGAIRYNVYTFLGPQTVFTYQDSVARSADTILDTLTYSSLQPVTTYHGLDWRGSFKYALGINWSLKGSINRTHQYSFLLSNTIALAPTDKWKLVDSNIRPMIGDQASLGVYSNLFRGNLQVSLEGYLKRVRNLVEYRDGADLLVNEVPEWDVLQGTLNAFGIEFMMRKPIGRLTGWLNYTYSRSLITVNGPGTEMDINFGLTYPANFDRPHSANVAATFKVNRRISLSANVVYATGRPITYPTSLFFLNSTQLVSFTTRNEYRLPDYFRLDLAMNVEGNLKARKLAHGSWSFSVYNVTGRDNVFNAYFSSVSGRIQGYRLSVFAIPVFSATYNFKLGNYES